ncbi:MAG: hypothetical protein EOP45_20670, partial [Sphingobacteriaceae bacterium]
MNGVQYESGCYHGQWDGYLDDGSTLAPLGTYTVKILTSNTKYEWEGVIGNTSTDFTGDYILKGDPMQDMCIVGTKAFMALGYSEHAPAQKMFLTTAIGKLANERTTQTTQSSMHVCTDGHVLYYAGLNYYNGKTWVFGAYVADNANPYAA